MLRSAETLILRESGSLQCPNGLIAHRAEGAELDYFAYVPRNASSASPLLVTVHGIERLALQHAVRFSGLAEKLGLVVLAPLFSKARLPRYQRVERGASGEHPIDALELTIDHFQSASGLQSAPLRLFGYSGGAQFAMRYAMLGNLPVGRLALAAPGWFTMPDETQAFPYGFAASEASEGRQPDLARMLSTPVLLTIGSEDTRRDASLNREKAVDAVQGRTRIERAHRWRQAMGDAAKARGLADRTEIQVLQGAGHDFNGNMQAHGLGEIVANWLLK